MPTRIEIEALNKTDGQLKVVDFSLSVPAGQIVGLVGRSSRVVLDILAGLSLPDAGLVRLNGFDITREWEGALQQVTAVLSPTPHHPSLWDKLLRDSPSILLLDEPMCDVYGRIAHTIERAIKHLAHEQNKTIVLTTCHLEFAHRLCDRVVVLKNGRFAADIPIIHDLNLACPTDYQIRVKGGLDARWTAWFAGLTMTTIEDETILSGTVADQSALHSLLTRIRDLGVPLVSVNRVELNLERSH